MYEVLCMRVFLVVQSGCAWNDVDNKIQCERIWYDEWSKIHKEAKGLYNVSFPYLSDLEIVYGKDRATGLVAEDPTTAAENTINVDIDLSVTDDSASNENEFEVDSVSQQQQSGSSSSKKKRKQSSDSSKVQTFLKKAKAKHVPNVESEFKALSDQVVGFMNSVSSHFESMSAFVQGKSSKIPEVLEELGRHGFAGKDKFKAAQAICEDPVKVELLFSLDPSEVQDYVLSFL
ncbi:hypothetical protein C2S53_001792 [Perilla frutescens var. hirtella]|uniref:Uncharacterized protein n=1 Tax=Perilla frutescens var. hirtella TaxID=608512 RepID=A0AAD4IPN0_PERFH|nr:hypothetical protein C2S53_001792 [Perilla frutescens var. hirtella]